jgi:S1-C subfamily serine protease
MKRPLWQVVLAVMILMGIVGGIYDTVRQRTAMAPTDPVVMIVEYDILGQRVSQGSGFFIDNKTVLTAGHVVKLNSPFNHLEVYKKNDKTHTNEVYQVESAYALKSHDVGRITIEGTYDGPVAPLGSTKDLKVGDPVLICGYMLALSRMGLDLSTTWGHVSDTCLYGGDSELSDRGDILLDITSYPGGSGGPVWCGGRVVAIVSRGIPGLLIVEPVDFR